MSTPHPLTDKIEWQQNIRRKTKTALTRAIRVEPFGSHRRKALARLHIRLVFHPWPNDPPMPRPSTPEPRGGKTHNQTPLTDGEADMLTRVFSGTLGD